ncbi:DUF5906 domain-containing protein [Thermophilibacter provencensis]|uniref:NrS-1 polymerase-like helicase domain-containing protein n=1 Tax=Thermophilibacter provencensis TaxID=1852386 RepID=A0A921GD63_9ACTN|nr:DUF5906 domain-containing protein [Thermophilibacter provencensis]HJF44595.1 hypothetical protein [Thermophilibacter provencensis]
MDMTMDTQSLVRYTKEAREHPLEDDWRDMSDAELVEAVLDSTRPDGKLLPPDVATSVVPAAILGLIGPRSIKRSEYGRLLDRVYHMPCVGYVASYNETVGNRAKISRVTRDAFRYAYALYDLALAAEDGVPVAVIDETPAQYVRDPAAGDDGPYRAIDARDFERSARRWSLGASREWVRAYTDLVVALAPHFATADALGLEEVRIRNGVYDRRTLTVRPYTPDDHFIGKFSGIEFPTDASGRVLPMTEPIVELDDGSTWCLSEWLEEIMPDPDGRRALLQLTACLLLPQLDVQRAFVLFGVGRNGKGTWVRLVMTMVGPEAERYVAHLSVEDFADEKKLPHIQGKLLNLSDESNPKGFLGDTAKIKAVISHDIVGGRPPYGLYREWQPVIALLFCLNAPISSAEHSDALYERFVFLNFPTAFFRKENPAIKDDYMCRREIASYAAYLALVEMRPFYDAKVFADNAYVARSNAEHRAEADPVLRAWEGISDDLALLEAVPCQLVYQLMRQWKKHNEPNGRMPGYTSREFRASLAKAASVDGWAVVPDQLPVARWFDEYRASGAIIAHADVRGQGIDVTYGPSELSAWLPQSHGRCPARTRCWLVKATAWNHFQKTGKAPKDQG